MAFRQCNHIKTDGIRCGSPALRGEQFCFFHHHTPDHRTKRQVRMVDVPFPEDAASIQVSLHNVMLAIIDRRIDERRASQLLWALQIASSQCGRLPFDNSIRQSRAVTELPEYEVAELEAEEANRRFIEDYRAEAAALVEQKKAAEREAAAHRAPDGAQPRPHTGESELTSAAAAQPLATSHSLLTNASDRMIDGAIESALGDPKATQKLFRQAGLMPRRRTG